MNIRNGGEKVKGAARKGLEGLEIILRQRNKKKEKGREERQRKEKEGGARNVK
jgi:hypothetical protein